MTKFLNEQGLNHALAEFWAKLRGAAGGVPEVEDYAELADIESNVALVRAGRFAEAWGSAPEPAYNGEPLEVLLPLRFVEHPFILQNIYDEEYSVWMGGDGIDINAVQITLAGMRLLVVERHCWHSEGHDTFAYAWEPLPYELFGADVPAGWVRVIEDGNMDFLPSSAAEIGTIEAEYFVKYYESPDGMWAGVLESFEERLRPRGLYANIDGAWLFIGPGGNVSIPGAPGKDGQPGERGATGVSFYGWNTAANLTNVSSIAGMAVGDFVVNTGTATRTILGQSTVIGGVVRSTSATAGTAAGNIRGPAGTTASITMPTTGKLAGMTPAQAFQYLSEWLDGVQQPTVRIKVSEIDVV